MVGQRADENYGGDRNREADDRYEAVEAPDEDRAQVLLNPDVEIPVLRQHNCLGPCVHAQFLEYSRYVVADRLFADEKLIADFLIRCAA